jgi:hypothetical protein
MTRRGFRKLILLWWLTGIACVVVTVASNRFLPPELRNYLEARAAAEPIVRDWILLAIELFLIIASVIISVGLYRFRPWARSLLLPSQLVPLLLLPFYGPCVMTGWASVMSYLSVLFTGGFLFLVYSSTVGDMFAAKGDSQQALRTDTP